MKIKEIKVVTVRECETPYSGKTPRLLADFWRAEIVKSQWFDAEKEALVVVLINTRMGIKGYNLVSLGLNNETLSHAREIFRPAIMGAASKIVLMHNHPSGNNQPSAADIHVTKEVAKAGEILGIELLDHVVVGEPDELNPLGFTSLREMGVLS